MVEYPLVSTWGEQRAQQITYDHPNFNSAWVKNYVAQQQQALDSLKFNLIIENKWAMPTAILLLRIDFMTCGT